MHSFHDCICFAGEDNESPPLLEPNDLNEQPQPDHVSLTVNSTNTEPEGHYEFSDVRADENETGWTAQSQ